MSIPSSSAPAVRQWLFDQMTAALTPDPNSPTSMLLVCFDEPGPNQPDDIVYVGKVTRHISVNSLVGGGGAGWLEERYSVDVDIDVYRGGDDPQTVYKRCSDLADAVVAIGRTDPSMGGNVLVGKPVTSDHDVTWDDAHTGRRGTATVVFECYQRI